MYIPTHPFFRQTLCLTFPFAVNVRKIITLHLFLKVVSVIATTLALSACTSNAPGTPTETGEPTVSATEMLSTAVPTAEPTVLRKPH